MLWGLVTNGGCFCLQGDFDTKIHGAGLTREAIHVTSCCQVSVPDSWVSAKLNSLSWSCSPKIFGSCMGLITRSWGDQGKPNNHKRKATYGHIGALHGIKTLKCIAIPISLIPRSPLLPTIQKLCRDLSAFISARWTLGNEQRSKQVEYGCRIWKPLQKRSNMGVS